MGDCTTASRIGSYPIVFELQEVSCYVSIWPGSESNLLMVFDGGPGRQCIILGIVDEVTELGAPREKCRACFRVVQGICRG